MLRCLKTISDLSVRAVSTNSVKSSTGVLELSKRDEYYRNLLEQEERAIPHGWDEALPFEKIPGLKPLPIIGNSWRFMPFVGEFYDKPVMYLHKTLHERYGNIISIRGMFQKRPMVFLYDPDDMEYLLRNSGSFPVRKTLLPFVHYRTEVRKDKFKGVGGLLTVQGLEWFKFRSTVNPLLMQPRVVEQYTEKVDKIAKQLMENMKYYSSLNEQHEMPDNFLDELYKWGLESVGVIALNRRLGCLDLNADENSESRKFVKLVRDMFDLFHYLEMTPPIWKYFKTPAYKKLIHTLDGITNTTFKYIDECLKEPFDDSQPEHQWSVLRRLVKEDKLIAYAMVTDMLFAGVDTTGKTMGAILYFLATNPEKQAILREELIQNLPSPDTTITNEVLKKSPYLKACIKEATRIAPIAIANLRTTTKDLVLHGYQVPKDTDVIAMHLFSALHSKQFKDPLKYIPERFLKSTQGEYSYKEAHPFAFMPFGHGPRSCIGKRFAYLELEATLAKIIRNLDLSWQQPEAQFEAKLLHGISSPLKLTVKPLT